MRVYLDLSVPRAFRSKRITCVETFTERIIHCVCGFLLFCLHVQFYFLYTRVLLYACVVSFVELAFL